MPLVFLQSSCLLNAGLENSRSNLVSKQARLHNIFISGMLYCSRISVREVRMVQLYKEFFLNQTSHFPVRIPYLGKHIKLPPGTAVFNKVTTIKIVINSPQIRNSYCLVRLTQFLMCAISSYENSKKFPISAGCSFLYLRLLMAGTYCSRIHGDPFRPLDSNFVPKTYASSF